MENVTGSGEEPESRTTAHIYVLSFTYGILIIVVLGHLVFRWQWRRKKLSHFKAHTPGDKSFRSTGIRERISADFASITAISPDPRLVNDSFKPSDFGANSDEEGATPSHWYRMKAFDVAADFVTANSSVLWSPTPPPSSPLPSLPAFLAALQERGVAATSVEGGAVLVDRCSQLYTHARYQDGRFDQPEFEEFNSLISKLQNRLSPDVASSSSLPPHSRTVSPAIPAPIGGRHSHLITQSSMEPLLSPSFGSSVATSPTTPPASADVLPPKRSPGRLPSRSSSSKKARAPSELVPLVSSSYSEPFSPTGSITGAPGRSSGSETPV